MCIPWILLGARHPHDVWKRTLQKKPPNSATIGYSPKLKVNFCIVIAPMGEGPGETHKGLSMSVRGSRTQEVLTELPETRTMEKMLIDCIDVEQQLGLSLFSKGDVTGPWLVGGDFNEIVATHEYLGRQFRAMSQMRDFGAALEDCGLSTVGFKGYKFTWSNRWRGGSNVKLCLDSMVANDLMFLAFPDMLTHHLNSVVLDHLPILMGFGLHSWASRKRRFMFEEL
ncbi:unnamed protein product [Prunus brigantina]